MNEHAHMLRFVTLVAMLLAAPAAWARAKEPASFPRLSIGGGFVGSSGLAEVTVSPLVVGPHVSAGIEAGGHGAGAYGEVAANLILTVGLGAGYQLLGDDESEASWHLFAGLPIPFYGWWLHRDRTEGGRLGVNIHGSPPWAHRLVYAVPFVRVKRFFGADRSDTSFGVLVKLSFGRVERTAAKELTPRAPLYFPR